MAGTGLAIVIGLIFALVGSLVTYWLIYSKIVRQANESYYADLYLRNLESEKEVRLTKFARAMEPSFSPDMLVVPGRMPSDVAAWAPRFAAGTRSQRFAMRGPAA